MTDWLRVLGYCVLSVLVILGSWSMWSRRKLRNFRLTDAEIKAMQDSQRGRRPMWLQDQNEKNDQSRVDREC